MAMGIKDKNGNITANNPNSANFYALRLLVTLVFDLVYIFFILPKKLKNTPVLLARCHQTVAILHERLLLMTIKTSVNQKHL